MSDPYRATYEYPGVWTVYREDDEDRWLLFGVSEGQARYAEMILEAGGYEGATFSETKEEIEEMIEEVECSRCGTSLYRGQVDPDGRCPRCQP